MLLPNIETEFKKKEEERKMPHAFIQNFAGMRLKFIAC